jgi:hypothetical protein
LWIQPVKCDLITYRCDIKLFSHLFWAQQVE